LKLEEVNKNTIYFLTFIENRPDSNSIIFFIICIPLVVSSTAVQGT
jgi:hypothetical protein